MRCAARIDGPVAVIGDVHGEADKLRTVLGRLRASEGFERRWVVFIGDFVDRGPDAASVIQQILQLHAAHPQTTAVAGNHEFAMAAALGLIPTPDYSDWDRQWVAFYDSEPTFRSYGAEPGDLAALRNLLPEPHRQLLADLPWCVEHPHYLFVHAGLSSAAPFEMQLSILRQKDFSLGKPQWLCEKFPVDASVPVDCPVTVVSGHVHVAQVQFCRRRILLDTCAADGELSCVLLPEKTVLTSGDQSALQAARPWWRKWGRAA